MSRDNWIYSLALVQIYFTCRKVVARRMSVLVRRGYVVIANITSAYAAMIRSPKALPCSLGREVRGAGHISARVDATASRKRQNLVRYPLNLTSFIPIYQ